MIASIEAVGAKGGSFLVGCRTLDGKLKCMDDLVIPIKLKQFFRAIPEDLFRMDISSTQLRERN